MEGVYCAGLVLSLVLACVKQLCENIFLSINQPKVFPYPYRTAMMPNLNHKNRAGSWHLQCRSRAPLAGGSVVSSLLVNIITHRFLSSFSV